MSFNILDVAASGMNAQRVKMDVISSNIANMNTTRNPDGTRGVYKKKEVSFEAIYADKLGSSFAMPNGEAEVFYSRSKDEPILKGGVFFDEKDLSQGVRVGAIENSKEPYKTVYDPSHPDANADGFVTLPNINVVEEMIDMVSASKAYEANATIAETVKNLTNTALRI